MYWLVDLVKRFLFLSILIAVWVGILWFVIRLDISRFNFLSLAAIHALPPLSAWGGWSLWQRYAAAKKLKDEEAAKEQVVVEKQVKRDTERKSFDAALRERQFALDCRWAEVCSNQSDLIGSNEIEPMSESDGDVLAGDRLLATLRQSLINLFHQCPGAQRLPIFVAESALFDRERVSEVITACCDTAIRPQVHVLPSTEGIANTVFSHFKNDPNLPGALFLSVDGSDQVNVDDEDALMPVRLKPADTLVLLLFTHPEYAVANTELEAETGQVGEAVDPMTPFWERNQRRLQGLTERLSQIPSEARDSLGALEVLGKLRRPEEVTGKKLKSAWRNAIEQALINANLKQLTFETKTDEAAAVTEEDISCGWVVHDAGTSETTINALCALSQSLNELGIEIECLKQATNVQSTINLGALAQWACVAVALKRAQALGEPTLWAAFGERKTVGWITNPS